MRQVARDLITLKQTKVREATEIDTILQAKRFEAAALKLEMSKLEEVKQGALSQVAQIEMAHQAMVSTKGSAATASKLKEPVRVTPPPTEPGVPEEPRLDIKGSAATATKSTRDAA
jgi:hypothetical protein